MGSRESPNEGRVDGEEVHRPGAGHAELVWLRFTLGMEHWGSFSRALGSQTEEGQVWHRAEPSEARGHVPGSPMSASPSCSVLGQHTLLR